ncbi:MAG: group II intron reverse transcriptase/maturase [Mariprofundaceae bacterium]|nr:group II intron reverse transcriptase/maturase [Mariprofundaceae bacterium]
MDKGVKGGKWFSLIDKVYALSTLNAAWQQVKTNKGCAGVDRVSIERFQAKADTYLQELHVALKHQTYQPEAVKRVYVPKSGGKHRPLGIPTVKDRVVQATIKIVIEPIFEYEFLPMSYAFRPQRGCKDALREVQHFINEGYTHVVDADLEGFFDNIPPDELMQQLEQRISDGKLLEILQLFLQQDVMDGITSWTPTMGTPQGTVLSPLLANIYLHPLDQHIKSQGMIMVRYADDFVILCRSETEACHALEEVRAWVDNHGLSLHPDKTHRVDCSQKGQGFDFLGYHFEAGKRWVRRKSHQALRDKIREKTKRNRSGSMKSIIDELNPMLIGWFNYFKHAHRGEFKSVDGFIRRRLRAMLLRRNKRKGWGKSLQAHMRWKNAYFAKVGLFTMHEARLSLCQSR